MATLLAGALALVGATAAVPPISEWLVRSLPTLWESGSDETS